MATTLSVWEFDSSTGAAEAVDILERLQSQSLIKVADGAIVSWEAGAKRPKTTQLTSVAVGGALGGSFWGLLFGLIFFMPLLGMAIGAASGALAGSLANVGIDNAFVKRIRDDITPGTSALFALTSDAVVDKVAQAFQGKGGRLLETNLSNEQEATLREAFAG
jgi:uncharacterized membrane protein